MFLLVNSNRGRGFWFELTDCGVKIMLDLVECSGGEGSEAEAVGLRVVGEA